MTPTHEAGYAAAGPMGDAMDSLREAFAAKFRAAAARCTEPALAMLGSSLLGSPRANHRILALFSLGPPLSDPVPGVAASPGPPVLELEIPLAAAARASARQLAVVALFALRAASLRADLDGIEPGVEDHGEGRLGSLRLTSFTGEVFAHVCEHYAPAHAGLFLHFAPTAGEWAMDDRNFVAAARLRGAAPEPLRPLAHANDVRSPTTMKGGPSWTPGT